MPFLLSIYTFWCCSQAVFFIVEKLNNLTMKKQKKTKNKQTKKKNKGKNKTEIKNQMEIKNQQITEKQQCIYFSNFFIFGCVSLKCLIFQLTFFRTESTGKNPSQFFSGDFQRHRYPASNLPNVRFQPFLRTCLKFQGHIQCQSEIELEPRESIKKIFFFTFSGQIFENNFAHRNDRAIKLWSHDHICNIF